jgi:hypothetical protein
MTVTVKHPFVSTVPDSADTSLVRPSNWNADHTIVGLGTAAELNAGVANGVATLDAGGTVPLSQIPASIQGTLSYQGTWNASTNTPTLASGVGTKGYYYVVSVAGSTNLDGITDWNIGDMAVYNGTAWQQIDNTDAVTSVNGYTGTVVLAASDVGAPTTSGTGATGTWAINVTGSAASASTATTATNLAGGSTGQIAYQSAAGTTTFVAAGASGQVLSANGGGIPTWIANSVGTVTSVGTGTGLTGGTITSTGTINFSNSSVATWADTPSSANLAAAVTDETGSGALVFGTSPSLSSPTIDGANPYIQFNNGSAVTNAAGRLWYSGSDGTWNMGMGGGNITQQVGEELFVYGKASATITDSPLQIIYQTGVVGASGHIEFAPTVAGLTDGNLILGCATENIATNGFGRITTYGTVHGITTNGTAYGETWVDGDVIWYNPTTGNPTKTKPTAPNIKVQIGIVTHAGSGGSGSFFVLLSPGTALGGTDSNVNITSVANNNLLQYNSASQYWTNVTPASVTGVGSATNLAGGVAGAIPWQSASGTTGFTAAGTTGQVLTSAGTGTPTWTTPAGSNITAQGLYENAATISANYTIGTGNNAISAGPITVASGVTVTVPSGSVWTVV